MNRNLSDKHIACKNCYLSLSYNNCPSRIADVKKSIIFIGDKPSSVDTKVGIPFQGRNNKIITQYINDFKLETWSSTTNLIKCYCIEPNLNYADKCINILIEEIKKSKPLIIVPIGSFVYKRLNDLITCNMKRVVNKPTRYANSIMIPIYSPSYIKKENIYNEYDKSFDLISDIFAELCIDYKIYR